ncbi:MAG: hypothetical protein H0U92_03215 [Actinobacteria bacterium]|nr:hypothetical protein [Actinomycetota bacterium]
MFFSHPARLQRFGNVVFVLAAVGLACATSGMAHPAAIPDAITEFGLPSFAI